jgi:hypothetical protein
MPRKTIEARRAYRKEYGATENGRAKIRAGNTAWRKRNLSVACELQKDWRRRQGREYYAKKILPGRYKNFRPCSTKNCECCGTPFDQRKKEPHADHDHIDNHFRGWLCGNCNLALGYVKDSRDRLQLLINYLDNAKLLK